MDCIGCARPTARARVRALRATRTRLRNTLALGAGALLLTACASGGVLGTVTDRALAAVGLDPLRAAADARHTVELEVHGAHNLNAGRGSKGVALVVRVYQLRDPQRFEQLPMAHFLDTARERGALGEDVVDVEERVVLPGDRQAWTLRLAGDARHVGVVALFRHAGDGPWRFVFDGSKAVRERVVIGAHACALTTASPALSTVLSGDPMRLSGVRCGP
ncbi:type VI secretion system lipoprotein TssJ [Lysobacter olei]